MHSDEFHRSVRRVLPEQRNASLYCTMMKRWNGWGDESIHMRMPPSAAQYLAAVLGEGARLSDASFQDTVAQVPASSFARHPYPLLQTDAAARLLRARGQSLPDWIALRSGEIGAFPDAVAFAHSDDDVRAALQFARAARVAVIPYGGGTSVVGHINPERAIPTITLDVSGLNQLYDLDATSQLATFGAGVTGPDLEAKLRVRGYTLGHFPQSWEYSTLGGWIAARSSGQQSYYYGRIENLFAGGRVETPLGELEIPPLPASAAGPDVRQIILGSEGRAGVITRATVRIRPLPEYEAFHAGILRDWETGVRLVRELAQARTNVSMLRLSDADETHANLMLAGHANALGIAQRALNLAGYGAEKCLLLFGVTGTRRECARVRRQVENALREFGGLPVPFLLGDMWRQARFRTPYLRNTLWEMGYALDTLETAVPWSRVAQTASDLKNAIRYGLQNESERVLVFAHLSHVYADGASIYVTYAFRRAPTPQQTLARWEKLKTAASHSIVAQRGTISHQHGVGVDHAPYLIGEKGALGVLAIQESLRALDPYEMMNPGKLVRNED
jgi:alkyldihydroxyacetonephosphate synthase